MRLAADVLIGVVALLHMYFLLLEMVLWDKPLGMKVFRMTAEKAAMTKQLAMNQGLYNGFLAAGLAWSLVSGSLQVKLFFLACVFVAGVFGAATVSRRIFWIQAAPAGVALILLHL